MKIKKTKAEGFNPSALVNFMKARLFQSAFRKKDASR